MIDDQIDEQQEWLSALESVVRYAGVDRAVFLIQHLIRLINQHAHVPSLGVTTPYCNTFAANEQVPFPDHGAVAMQASHWVRWNAIAMVAGAAQHHSGLGGHISTYASSAVLYDIGFDHFFKARSAHQLEDCIYVQGHASPGIYARAFLTGQLTKTQLEHFRRETGGQGVSSYPHPWLMPDFWQFPTVSMGLGPLCAVYQARWMKYAIHRELMPDTQRKVWAFCGDGEMDEPETLSAISFASYEQLNNLIFVINCNLQRLDGLVRSHGQIVQELEARFKASGWRVIKVLFSSAWDDLFEKDVQGVLTQALGQCVDGQFQRFSKGRGAVWREEFFNQSDALKALIDGWSDTDLDALSWGGHDPQKVYTAYHAAVTDQAHPTVILAQTTKGYGVPGAAGMNTAHNVKSLSEDNLQAYAQHYDLPLTAEAAAACALIEPDDQAPPVQYLKACRQALGGPLPARHTDVSVLPVPELSAFSTLLEGSGAREISSTMAFVRILSQLLKTPTLGPHVIPISPDESRTFGMEGLFRQIGIYNPHGQTYEPVDRDQVMYYREAKDGQFLQEGINEAGAMASWIAAATAYSHSSIPMVPFYIFYSMFGFQRVGDLIWAAGDSRARGFLIGATSGRTTLAGEGLQHTDGHSHVMAATVPNCKSYDPTFGYELAVIIQHGLQQLLVEQVDAFYYLTVVNENIEHLPMPDRPEVAEGIIRGIYLLEVLGEGEANLNLLGSGAILPEVRQAAQRLHEDEGWTVHVWSVTSFNELARDGRSWARQCRLDPAQIDQIPLPFIQDCLPSSTVPVIAATDYIAAYADQVRAWIPGPYHVLGTDGFGRSDTRDAMRRFFEVDAGMIAYTACVAQYEAGCCTLEQVQAAVKRYDIVLDRPDPATH